MSYSSFVDENNIIHFQNDGKDFLLLSESLDEKSGTVIVSLSGELRADAVHGFRDELLALASVKIAITLNLAELTYICNSGMGALVDIEQDVERTGKGSLILTAVSKPVMDSLKQTSLDQLLDIEK